MLRELCVARLTPASRPLGAPRISTELVGMTQAWVRLGGADERRVP
jgi:hypothetical protein